MSEKQVKAPVEKYRRLSKPWWLFIGIVTSFAIILSIDEIFLGPVVIHEYTYYFTLLGLFVACSFVLLPASKGAPRDKVPWYDILLMVLCLVGCGYMAAHSFEIIDEAWVYVGPTESIIISIGLWFICLEALRRAGGLPLLLVATFFSFYSLFAVHLPGFLEGTGWSFWEAAKFHTMGGESLIGIPTKVMCNLVIGFMIFGVALQATGGGRFFLNFASALFGAVRGGPAKVSIFASALFGSMSGAVLSNVITTGSITIPTMKKTGYPAYYAAAVEAVASTGGCIMPPVMGAVAFIMASFLVVPYSTVVLAAIVPALLYYFSLFVQLDSYAAKTGLRGMPKSELPSPKQTLREGWIYVFALVALIYLLFYLKREAQAPYYATALLFAGAMARKETRVNLKSFFNFIVDSGKVLSEMMAILAGIGLIIGGLLMTGIALSFSSELVHLVGEHVIPLLLIAAFASFILGMGMTVSACYIFLVFTVAPVLLPLGFDVLAVHLFVMYCGLMSFITPPVALGAYAAAGIANSNPIKTGFQAMRLGIALYFVPFFFVLDPCLILHGPPLMIFQSVTTAFLGMFFIASSIEGYLAKVGRLAIPLRVLCFSGGFLLCLAGWRFDLIGIVLGAIVVVMGLLHQRSQKSKLRDGV